MMDKSRPLGTLQDYVNRLETLLATVRSATVKDKCQAKLAALRGEAVLREERLQQLLRELDSVKTATEATNWRITAAELKGALDGSNRRGLLDEADVRANKLAHFFSKLDGFAGQVLQSSDHCDNLLRSVDSLKADNHRYLKDAQIERLESAKSKIDDDRRSKIRSAEEWLDSCQDALNAGNELTKLQRRLTEMPAFLPAQKMRGLEKLRMEVQQRIDEDAVTHILELFQQIHDNESRQKCLKRLQAMVEVAGL
jgi:hypothetical protein